MQIDYSITSYNFIYHLICILIRVHDAVIFKIIYLKLGVFFAIDFIQLPHTLTRESQLYYMHSYKRVKGKGYSFILYELGRTTHSKYIGDKVYVYNTKSEKERLRAVDIERERSELRGAKPDQSSALFIQTESRYLSSLYPQHNNCALFGS